MKPDFSIYFEVESTSGVCTVKPGITPIKPFDLVKLDFSEK